MKKLDCVIPYLIGLLAPEGKDFLDACAKTQLAESTIVHEFAALCLSHLAQDYTTKVTILENVTGANLASCLFLFLLGWHGTSCSASSF